MIIGIIGTGNIGSVFAERLVKYYNVTVYDPDRSKAAALSVASGCRVSETAAELAEQADVIIVAVKPAVAIGVVKEIAAFRKMIITTAAAVDEQCYYDAAGQLKLFRIMPTMVNSTGGPLMLVNGRYTDEIGQNKVKELLGRVGKVYVIPENEINAYMCVMSCSPAVFAEFVRQYTENFCRITGIDSGKALDTVLDMIEHLAPAMRREGYELIDKVCTPGGISEVGVNDLVRHKQIFKDMAKDMLERTDEICAAVRRTL